MKEKIKQSKKIIMLLKKNKTPMKKKTKAKKFKGQG
jgi:hypothetical protein